MLTACSGGGNASSTVPRGASDGAASAAAQSGIRRPDTAYCMEVSSTGFVGSGENYAAGADAGVLNGSGNSACDAASGIGAGTSNIISSASNLAAFGWIGGGNNNTITGTAAYSSIGSGSANSITNQFAFVGSGASNTVSGEYGAIAGGYENTASAEWATVAGGTTNTASGNGANVAGGAHNTASGAHATVLGGSQNTASGNQSLAAGYNSDAATVGAFVWSDDSGTTGLTSTVANEFLARASGGVTFWTNAAGTVGATLAPGSGAWASASDRNMKTNIVALDDAEVLDRVGRLPVSSWSYVTEHGVRHVGPMAQDFYAAFGVGEDDRHITSIDEDGVALAAIKALRDQNTALRAQQRKQAATDRQVARQQASMQREIARLNTLVGSLARQANRVSDRD